MMRRRATLAAAATLVLGACTADSAPERAVRVDSLPGGIPRILSLAPAEAGRWSLVADRVLQPDEGDAGELLDPASVALADDGSVLVMERSPAQVRIYGRDGTLRRTLGRPGQGPGEFRAGRIAVRGDTLVVQDPSNQRLSTWDWREGRLIAERRSSCCLFAPIDVDGDGRVWVPIIGRPADTTFTHYRKFLRTPLTGSEVDTVMALDTRGRAIPPSWEYREGGELQMSITVPLQPSTAYVPDPTGTMLVGWSGEYWLRESSDGVDTVRMFGRAFTPARVSEAQRRHIAETAVAEQLRGDPGFGEALWRQMIDPALIPSTFPAWIGFDADRAGRRWLQVPSADSTTTAFDVFDREGRWLDSIAVPAALWPSEAYPTAFARDEVAIVTEGPDGRPLIRVFRVERR